MRVLIVGGGGREHALAWKVAQSASVDHVYVAPGNAGTATEAKVSNVNIGAEDRDALLAFALDNAVELTIVGPEAPLVAGITDAFQAAGLQIFGPSAAAAQLEGSKAFSKAFLARHHIPTASYDVFTDLNEAIAHIKSRSMPCVIKADGLAAGKGVIIAESHEHAIETATDMLDGNRFGEAGHRLIIEDFMRGEEASFICMVDGEHILPMASSQDHKARDDGDVGPNTGGMGAYSPAPVVDSVMHAQIMQSVIEPTVAGMAADGAPFTGFLYAGLMICDDGIARVVEFNVRFGDPEAQPLLMRLNSDLAELCIAACNGELDKHEARWDSRCALGVVMAAGGYPDAYEKGHAISGIEYAENETRKVFHAGTKNEGDAVVTAGGRVLCVTSLGDSVSAAQSSVYEGIDKISWQDAFCRRDIGYRAIARDA
ncbi:MAG: phosphoribosylamine--glycine ligase [Pseudomonadota bacterium]